MKTLTFDADNLVLPGALLFNFLSNPFEVSGSYFGDATASLDGEELVLRPRDPGVGTYTIHGDKIELLGTPSGSESLFIELKSGGYLTYAHVSFWPAKNSHQELVRCGVTLAPDGEMRVETSWRRLFLGEYGLYDMVRRVLTRVKTLEQIDAMSSLPGSTTLLDNALKLVNRSLSELSAEARKPHELPSEVSSYEEIQKSGLVERLESMLPRPDWEPKKVMTHCAGISYDSTKGLNNLHWMSDRPIRQVSRRACQQVRDALGGSIPAQFNVPSMQLSVFPPEDEEMLEGMWEYGLIDAKHMLEKYAGILNGTREPLARIREMMDDSDDDELVLVSKK